MVNLEHALSSNGILDDVLKLARRQSMRRTLKQAADYAMRHDDAAAEANEVR